MITPLPPGYTVRPTEHSDAEAVLDILHANALALGGEPETTLKDILDEWGDPDLDLERNTRVVIAPDGRLIAQAIVWIKGREALPIAEIYMHHDLWATDTVTEPFLLAWAETLAQERSVNVAPDTRIAMRVFSDVRETRYIGLVEQAGFHVIRHSFRMGVTFNGPPDPGQNPDGFMLRPAEKDDIQAVFESWRDAWRDHFGYIERPREVAWEAWAYEWQNSFAPGLWWLALDGETVAGFCMALPEYGGDESMGFIELLAVRRAYRRRGLAESILRRSLAGLYAAGKSSAILYVDGESLTGATRLYEKAGMAVQRTYALCEKELRPGVDPSTREAT